MTGTAVFLKRLATSPLRPLVRRFENLSLSHLDVARPGWWPPNRVWPLGPRGPHEGRQVVISVGGRRLEFVPVAWGRYRGHMFRGELRPDEPTLAARLHRLDLPVSVAKAFATVSSFEGGFDSLQTFDHSRFCWGFIQFGATGGLPRLLYRIKSADPALFHARFVAAGIDVDERGLKTRGPHGLLRGAAAVHHLRSEPRLWKWFVLAAHDRTVQDVQIRSAYDDYYARVLDQTVALRSGTMMWGALFPADGVERAALFDRAVQRGTRVALELFARAAQRSGVDSPDNARRLLDVAMQLEPDHRRRWESLRDAFDG
jgi:hypothetical protein